MSTVERIDAATFRTDVATLAHVYGAAMHRSPELVVQRREVMAAHVTRPGFAAVVARSAAGDIVGFGYGYRGRPGEWWHDVVVRALGDLATHWLADAFELAELHVLPDHQGRGLGRALLEALLGLAAGATVVLSTHDRDSPARHLYRSVGFVDLLGGLVFPGSSEVYAIMGLDR